MENIIEEICNIEEKSEEIINDAVATKNSMAQNLDNILNEMNLNLDTIANDKINEFVNNRKAETEEKLSSLKAYYQNLNDKLDIEFDHKKEKYVNQIFDNIIKG